MTAEMLPLPDPPPPTPDASPTAHALTAALRDHYLKPAEPLPGGVFLTELTDDLTARRVDALSIGFWRSTGQRIDGHEIKVSRSDWLRELKDPGKAGPWFDRCHRWWLVVPSVAVARPEELPDGWGLMVPGSKGRRFRVVVPAPLRQPTVDLPFLLAVSKRLDTARSTAVSGRVLAERVEARAQEAARRATELVEQANAADVADRLRTLTELEEAFGGPITRYWAGDGEHRTTAAAEALRAWAGLIDAETRLGQVGGRELDRLDQVLRSHADALAAVASAAEQVRRHTGGAA